MMIAAFRNSRVKQYGFAHTAMAIRPYLRKPKALLSGQNQPLLLLSLARAAESAGVRRKMPYIKQKKTAGMTTIFFRIKSRIH
jgi:hypothetical protein